MALSTLQHFSTALGRHTAANVILPEVGEPPYPTLYLLHGLSDDETIWARQTRLEAYLQSTPLIVVMPEGGRGWYSDAEEGDLFMSALAIELVDRIERTFPAQKQREGRFVAGLSMGGYGALKFGLTFPDRFSAAVSMSGALDFGHGSARMGGRDITPEYRRITGPDPAGGTHDLWALVDRADPARLPALRIDCGVDDFLLEANRAFHTHLVQLGLPHEYAEYPGDHNWEYWNEHVRETIAFCLSVHARSLATNTVTAPK